MRRWSFGKKSKVDRDKTLAKLITEYLLQCPCKGASAKGRYYRDIGWYKNSVRSLVKEMRSIAGISEEHWSLPEAVTVEKAIEQINRINHYDCSFEFLCADTGENQLDSIFKFIRNAFAHGSFNIDKYEGTEYYVLENRRNKVLRGRAIVKANTLLEWYSILSNGPDKLKRIKRNKSGKHGK